MLGADPNHGGGCSNYFSLSLTVRRGTWPCWNKCRTPLNPVDGSKVQQWENTQPAGTSNPLRLHNCKMLFHKLQRGCWKRYSWVSQINVKHVKYFHFEVSNKCTGEIRRLQLGSTIFWHNSHVLEIFSDICRVCACRFAYHRREPASVEVCGLWVSFRSEIQDLSNCVVLTVSITDIINAVDRFRPAQLVVKGKVGGTNIDTQSGLQILKCLYLISTNQIRPPVSSGLQRNKWGCFTSCCHSDVFHCHPKMM